MTFYGVLLMRRSVGHLARRPFATTLPPGTPKNYTSIIMNGNKKGGDYNNTNQKPDSSALNSPKVHPKPHRLVVKRNNNAPPDETPPNVGMIIQKRRRRKKEKTPTQIKDSWGQPMIIVPAKRRLPILNASALLHTKDYCVHSASSQTSKSGLGAARRLLKGKQDFLNLLRGLVHSPSPQRFVLQGHGVPEQLLQEHVELAHDLLVLHDNAASFAFHYHPKSSSSSSQPTDSLVLEKWMRIRQRDGSHRVVPWPPTAPRPNRAVSWQDSMQLYVTVMQRLATKLGASVLVVPDESPSNEEDEETLEDDYDNEFHATSRVYNDDMPPHHWTVEFARRQDANNQFYMAEPSPLQLTVEWSPITKGPSAPGHVRLQLQGTPRDGVSVRLSLDASFQNPTTTTTTTPP